MVGIGVILFALGKMGMAVSFGGAILFGALVLNGVLIYYSILFVLSVWTFWIGRSNNLMELYWQFGQFSRYPGDIYPWFLRKLYGGDSCGGSNVPAGLLIYKLEIGGIFYGFALGAVFLSFTVWIWKKGLQRYCSASCSLLIKSP